MKKQEHPEYQYLNLLTEILKDGVKNVDRGTKAVSYSLFGRQCRYDLSKGFPLLTTKKTYWKGILYELFWFIKGKNNIKYLIDQKVHIWDDYPYKIYCAKHTSKKSKILSKEEFIQKITDNKKFAEKWGNLPRIYGEMWRRWPTKHGKPIDQLKWAISELREDPYARNAIVNSWNPEFLYTMARVKDTSYFPICHNMYQLSIKDKKVHLHLYQRSADMFLGVPFNIGSYALLTIIIAHVLGLKPGEFIHSFGDVHIYENHLEQVREQIKRKPKPFPTIKILKKTNDIDKLNPEDIVLENYESHPLLRGELSVSGGYFKKKKK